MMQMRKKLTGTNLSITGQSVEPNKTSGSKNLDDSNSLDSPYQNSQQEMHTKMRLLAIRQSSKLLMARHSELLKKQFSTQYVLA